jgi:hypothetical protein
MSDRHVTIRVKNIVIMEDMVCMDERLELDMVSLVVYHQSGPCMGYGGLRVCFQNMIYPAYTEGQREQESQTIKKLTSISDMSVTLSCWC